MGNEQINAIKMLLDVNQKAIKMNVIKNDKIFLKGLIEFNISTLSTVLDNAELKKEIETFEMISAITDTK
jgi:hypothetical protein